MKTTKLTYLMAIGLALMFVATGCKKSPTTLTNLKNRGGGVGDPNLDSNKLNTTDPQTGLHPTTTSWQRGDYNEDRAALAAHTVHFDFDSHVVKSSEKGHVQAVAAALSSEAAAKLVIEGHCDERGTDEYNRSLGERRALALREELANMGIDAERIMTQSFGKDKPVDNAQSESAYAKNRRGEFILMRPK